MRMILSRVTAKWQTTVPRAVREALGVGPGDTISYRIEGDQVFVSKADDEDEHGDDDIHSDAELQPIIDEALKDTRPTIPAEEVFTRVFAHIESLRRERNAA